MSSHTSQTGRRNCRTGDSAIRGLCVAHLYTSFSEGFVPLLASALRDSQDIVRPVTHLHTTKANQSVRTSRFPLRTRKRGIRRSYHPPLLIAAVMAHQPVTIIFIQVPLSSSPSSFMLRILSAGMISPRIRVSFCVPPLAPFESPCATLPLTHCNGGPTSCAARSSDGAIVMAPAFNQTTVWISLQAVRHYREATPIPRSSSY